MKSKALLIRLNKISGKQKKKYKQKNNSKMITSIYLPYTKALTEP